MNKHVFEAVDRTFRDLLGVDVPFGGKVVVFGGDFRQVLPVIPRAAAPQIVASCINRASFWDSVKVMKLTENMRVQQLQREGADATAQLRWKALLERIGDGTEPTQLVDGQECVKLPSEVCLDHEKRTLQGLVDSIFGEARWSDRNWLTERAILASRNEEVDELNQFIGAQFPCAEEEFVSLSSDEGTELEGSFPVEFLNSLNPSGLPPHRLTLKVDMPIMLLRNMNGSRGQANGTRLVCRGFTRRVIDAEIATGSGQHVGKRIFIPRITLSPSDDGTQMPFKLKRRQFPVRPAFAMTINKAQGQTMKAMGLYLPSFVFSHGQLYVAFSRVGGAHCAKVHASSHVHPDDPEGVYTKNVVFREVFG